MTWEPRAGSEAPGGGGYQKDWGSRLRGLEVDQEAHLHVRVSDWEAAGSGMGWVGSLSLVMKGPKVCVCVRTHTNEETRDQLLDM